MTDTLADGTAMKARSRWDAILASYSEEKRRWDRTFPWIAYVLRPASFLVTWLLPSRVTANQVTLLSFLTGAAALVLIAWGNAGLVAGTCLFAGLNFLDCVDGNLARMRAENLPSGKFYDAAVGLIFYLVYLALGLGLFWTPDTSLSTVLMRLGTGPAPPVIYLLLGTTATLARYLSLHLGQIFSHSLGERWAARKAEGAHATHTGRWYYRLYHNVTDVQAQDPILIGAAVTGFAGLYLALSAVVQVLTLIGLTGYYIRRARTLDEMPP